MYHPLCLVYRRVSSTSSTPTSSSQDSVTDTENPATERSGRTPLQRSAETEKTKKKDTKKYKVIYCMNCRTGSRSAEKIWSTKAILWCHWETRSLRIKTLPVQHQWNREQKWNGVRASTVSTLTSRNIQMAISAWRK